LYKDRNDLKVDYRIRRAIYLQIPTVFSIHRPTALLSPSSDDKPEAATAVVVAPDDGHEDARNMLSCIYTTSNKLEKLLHLVG